MTLRIAEEQNKQNLDFDVIGVVVAGILGGLVESPLQHNPNRRHHRQQQQQCNTSKVVADITFSRTRQLCIYAILSCFRQKKKTSSRTIGVTELVPLIISLREIQGTIPNHT